jgi:hypothetical protein
MHSKPSWLFNHLIRAKAKGGLVMTSALRLIRNSVGAVTIGMMLAACADTPTVPRQAASHAAPSFDEICIDNCDLGGGGGGGATAPTYLTAFYVESCDPSFSIECHPTQNYDYYEIRQNLREANGTQIEYNEQRWHGDTGDLNQQVFSQNLCGNTGRYINVEIYSLHTGNILNRKATFNVTAADNGQLLHVGDLVTWAGFIKYHWTC